LFAFAPKPTGPSPGTLRVLETAIPKNAWFLQELLNEKASGTLDESNGTIVRLPSLDEPNNKMVEIYFDVLMSSQFAKSKWEWEKLMTSAEKYGQDNMMDRLWDIFVAWMEFVTRGVIQWLPWQTSSDNNDVRDMALFLNCHRKILDRFTNSYVPKWMAGGREVESAVGDQSGNKRKRSRVSKEDGQRKRQKMTKANKYGYSLPNIRYSFTNLYPVSMLGTMSAFGHHIFPMADCEEGKLFIKRAKAKNRCL